MSNTKYVVPCHAVFRVSITSPVEAVYVASVGLLSDDDVKPMELMVRWLAGREDRLHGQFARTPRRRDRIGDAS